MKSVNIKVSLGFVYQDAWEKVWSENPLERDYVQAWRRVEQPHQLPLRGSIWDQMREVLPR